MNVAGVLLLPRRPHPDATRLHGHDSSRLKQGAVLLQRLDHGRPLTTGAESDDPENASVGPLPNNDQLAKVLIERDQNALLLMRDFQQRIVTRISIPVPDPNHIMIVL